MWEMYNGLGNSAGNEHVQEQQERPSPEGKRSETQ